MIYENEMRNTLYPLKGALMKGDISFMNHCHQEMEIILICSGHLKVYSGEEEYHLRAGDVWMIPPFGNHGIGKGSADCVRMVIQFDMKIIGTRTNEKEGWIWVQNELNKRDMLSTHWTEGMKVRISNIVEKLYYENQKREFAWQLAMKTLISELLLIAVREMPKIEEKKMNHQLSKMKDILEYIAVNYCADIKLQNCAGAAGFNPSYLSRFFREHMGITFQEYVKQLRLEKVKWLLLTERIPITEICYQSGFQDIKTFNKLFKKEYGESPTQYRKRAIESANRFIA